LDPIALLRSAERCCAIEPEEVCVERFSQGSIKSRNDSRPLSFIETSLLEQGADVTDRIRCDIAGEHRVPLIPKSPDKLSKLHQVTSSEHLITALYKRLQWVESGHSWFRLCLWRSNAFLRSRGMSDASCVFCHILAGQEKGSFVYRGGLVAAFLTIGPVNPGHLLIVPLRHAAGVADLTREENEAMFTLAQRVSVALRQPPIAAEGINYWLADGEAAFQDVFHVHLHLIPRFAGDSLSVAFDKESPHRDELDYVARAISANLETLRTRGL
jgi:diadenosine tetraphosphate (Ap4A) HIT family hydrolase